MMANWDLYLISIITIVFGLFIYLQRPADVEEARANRPGVAGDAPAPADVAAEAEPRPAAAVAAEAAAPLLDDVQ